MKGFTNSIYKTSDWIMKLAYVNILWIIFSLIGLVILGLFPATIAMFTVVRKWVYSDQESFSAFKLFWNTYKKEFLKSNVIGLIIMIISYLFYLEIQFIQVYNHEFLNLFFYPLLILLFVFVLTVLYVFPTYVHYDIKIFHLIKNSFLMMVLNPISTIFMIMGCITIYILSVMFPVSVLFFSGSLFAFFTIKSAFIAFRKIEEKQNTDELMFQG